MRGRGYTPHLKNTKAPAREERPARLPGEGGKVFARVMSAIRGSRQVSVRSNAEHRRLMAGDFLVMASNISFLERGGTTSSGLA